METLRFPHIRVDVREGRVVLEVVDEELRDLVETYLTAECDLEYEDLQPATQGGRPCQMVFPPDVALTEVVVALNKLDPAEIERVFRINNPSTDGLSHATIYVYVEDEGVHIWRPIEADHLGDDRYEIVSVNRDAEVERWQFQTGDIVRCKRQRLSEGEALVAYELIRRSA